LPVPARATLEALKICDAPRLEARRGSAEQRPSMGRDMAKGRRAEIEFLNGFVVHEGEQAHPPASDARPSDLDPASDTPSSDQGIREGRITDYRLMARHSTRGACPRVSSPSR
jgi:hypothetical protein